MNRKNGKTIRKRYTYDETYLYCLYFDNNIRL